MTIEGPDAQRTDVPSLVTRLHDTVHQIDKDDLSGLAQMHQWCETLAGQSGCSGATGLEAIIQQAKTLANKLEALILGETEDPTATFAAITEAVSALASSPEGQCTESEHTSASSKDTTPSASSENEAGPTRAEMANAGDIATKLSNIFDEEPSSAETAETPEDVVPEPASSETSTLPAETPSAQTGDSSYEPVPLTIDPKEFDFVKGFVEEATEHIEAIEAALLDVEQCPEDAGKIDDLFRPFHTIKGMAGFLNLRDVNCLAHEAETLLDQGRKGQRQIDTILTDVIFDAVDILKVQVSLIATYMAKPEGDVVAQPPVTEMIGRLRDMVAGRAPSPKTETSPKAPEKVGEHLVAQGAVASEAVDAAVQAQKSKLSDKKVGEILVDMKVTTPRQVSQAIRAQKQEATGPQPGATSTSSQKPIGDQSVRIETAKLDALVDMVGELVIAQTQVIANPQVAASTKLTKDAGQVEKIVRDVQELAMAMRMVPIGPTFQKMSRLVRDVSRKAGKEVQLTISGDDTELDKNVIQQIGDPLMHMVRNAVDHGVETPDVRRSLKKKPVGYVHLAASHQGGNVVIEISDDGKGLDPNKLIAKGIERGIVQPGEELSEQQTFDLIFAPGFSMAEKITDISGRGVGMDVVKRNIEQLRGKVEIRSEKGRGSTFLIRLPLTLAIIDGMIIRVGTERLIIPTIAIEQSLRPTHDQITTVQHAGEVLNVRGQLIPLIQLGELFNLCGRIDPCEAMVVITQCDGKSVGLIAEELIGQQQVVIKSLGERFEGLLGIAGAAILGDGKVGLILEASGVAESHQARRQSSSKNRTNQLNDEEETQNVDPPATAVASEITNRSAAATAEPALT